MICCANLELDAPTHAAWSPLLSLTDIADQGNITSPAFHVLVDTRDTQLPCTHWGRAYRP